MYVSHEDPTSSPIYSAHQTPWLSGPIYRSQRPFPGTFKQRYRLNANYYKTGAEPTASWGMSTERELMGASLLCNQWRISIPLPLANHTINAGEDGVLCLVQWELHEKPGYELAHANCCNWYLDGRDKGTKVFD